MAEEKLIPEMARLKTYLEEQRLRFFNYGYDIDVRPFGQDTLGGRRGVILTATSKANGALPYTLSFTAIKSGIDQLEVMVDGAMHDVAPALVRMQFDVVEQVKRLIDWFIDSHVGKQRPSVRR